MRLFKLTAGLTICSLACLACISQAASAQSATAFTQQILPLVCTLSSVNNGVSTVNYLSPPDCSHVIEPGNNGNQPTNNKPVQQASHTNNNPTRALTTVSSKPASQNPKTNVVTTIKLYNNTAFSSPAGSSLVVSPRVTYYYQPASKSAKPHSFSVIKIYQNEVTTKLEPSGQQLTLKPGAAVPADFNKHGRPTIVFGLIDIQSNSDALLNIRLVSFSGAGPAQKSGSKPINYALAIVIIILAIALVKTLVVFGQRRLSRRGRG